MQFYWAHADQERAVVALDLLAAALAALVAILAAAEEVAAVPIPGVPLALAGLVVVES